jgi:hypothetical protein
MVGKTRAPSLKVIYEFYQYRKSRNYTAKLKLLPYLNNLQIPDFVSVNHEPEHRPYLVKTAHTASARIHMQQIQLLSNITFKICECPQMNNLGGLTVISCLIA